MLNRIQKILIPVKHEDGRTGESCILFRLGRACQRRWVGGNAKSHGSPLIDLIRFPSHKYFDLVGPGRPSTRSREKLEISTLILGGQIHRVFVEKLSWILMVDLFRIQSTEHLIGSGVLENGKDQVNGPSIRRKLICGVHGDNPMTFANSLFLFKVFRKFNLKK